MQQIQLNTGDVKTVRPSSPSPKGLKDIYKIRINFDDCSDTGTAADGTAAAHRKRNFPRNPEMFDKMGNMSWVWGNEQKLTGKDKK